MYTVTILLNVLGRLLVFVPDLYQIILLGDRGTSV